MSQIDYEQKSHEDFRSYALRLGHEVHMRKLDEINGIRPEPRWEHTRASYRRVPEVGEVESDFVDNITIAFCSAMVVALVVIVAL